MFRWALSFFYWKKSCACHSDTLFFLKVTFKKLYKHMRQMDKFKEEIKNASVHSTPTLRVFFKWDLYFAYSFKTCSFNVRNNYEQLFQTVAFASFMGHMTREWVNVSTCGGNKALVQTEWIQNWSLAKEEDTEPVEGETTLRKYIRLGPRRGSQENTWQGLSKIKEEGTGPDRQEPGRDRNTHLDTY